MRRAIDLEPRDLSLTHPWFVGYPRGESLAIHKRARSDPADATQLPVARRPFGKSVVLWTCDEWRCVLRSSDGPPRRFKVTIYAADRMLRGQSFANEQDAAGFAVDELCAIQRAACSS